jgi:hypothetical protein
MNSKKNKKTKNALYKNNYMNLCSPSHKIMLPEAVSTHAQSAVMRQGFNSHVKGSGVYDACIWVNSLHACDLPDVHWYWLTNNLQLTDAHGKMYTLAAVV